MIYHYEPVRTTNIKILIIQNVHKDMEQVELSYMAGENAILYRTGPLDNSLVFSYKDKNILKNIYFTF